MISPAKMNIKDGQLIEMGLYIDTLLYRNMQDSDTGIGTICNVSIHHVSQYIAIIGCINLNIMTCILRLLSWHCSYGRKLVCFIITLLHCLNIAIYQCIMGHGGAMHQYFQILCHPISSN